MTPSRSLNQCGLSKAACGTPNNDIHRPIRTKECVTLFGTTNSSQQVAYKKVDSAMQFNANCQSVLHSQHQRVWWVGSPLFRGCLHLLFNKFFDCHKIKLCIDLLIMPWFYLLKCLGMFQALPGCFLGFPDFCGNLVCSGSTS